MVAPEAEKQIGPNATMNTAGVMLRPDMPPLWLIPGLGLVLEPEYPILRDEDVPSFIVVGVPVYWKDPTVMSPLPVAFKALVKNSSHVLSPSS
jgi:hypothetical protein